MKQSREVIFYLIFGVLTTAVNILCYALCYDFLHISNVLSTMIAWIVSVLFAFVTNRKYVFESTASSSKAIQMELVRFIGCRALTGVMDLLIMFLAVDVMGGNGLLWKIISNVLVVVLNYIFSKLYIFKN